MDLGKSLSRKKINKRHLIVYLVLAVTLVLSVAVYIIARTYARAWRTGLTLTPEAFATIMGRALPALIAMAAAAAMIAIVSLSFQTIVGSRILTPSMIGFDAVFIGTHVAVVFMFGTQSALLTNPYINFAMSAGSMMLVSFFMFGFILRSGRNNVIFLLMFGIVLSGIIGSGTSYLSVIMDQYELFEVNARTNVTINNINTEIIRIAVPILIFLTAFMMSRHRRYNVMCLGSEQAKSLGLDYEKEISINLILIALGMSVATAMIGSLTFLGLLAVNIGREFMKTHKHIPLFICSAALAMIALIMGQGISELLLGAIPVAVIINLVGCSYVFYLILKENKL